MDTNTIAMPKIHQGKNIKRFRDILGVKQEALAAKLDITQQTLSYLEQKEQIDEKTLDKVAEALQIPIEAIKNMTDEAAVNIIASNNHDNSASVNYYPTFNPIEKLVELYERMLKAEQEKVSKLEEALKGKK